ncbi:MAG: hypothetical protein FWB86_11050 [Treponema sp.]|nr:hypothetical protein [Treponema sp.]
MYHPKLTAFLDRLKELFDEVDNHIEDLYGDRYPLRPMRPRRGETANPAADGLFNIGANFTPGFTSELGRGYLIDVSIATMEKVDDNVRHEIYEAATEKVKELLPVYFPEREFTVNRDGAFFKIQGDFSLGNV